MPVRKTESRVPAGFQPDQLGQVAASADAKSFLVSFISTPLVIARANTYVVLLTDPGLASNVDSYNWTVTEGGSPAVTSTTGIGELVYTPVAAGALIVSVDCTGGSGSQVILTLNQDIVTPNGELEALIDLSKEETGPGIGNPDVAREMVNDWNAYYQAVALTTAETGDGFKTFVFNTVYDGALQRQPDRRAAHMGQLSGALNDGSYDFKTEAAEAGGVAGIHLYLLAMVLSNGGGTFLPFTEFPEDTGARRLAIQQTLQALDALDDNAKIDLFNLVRFPKANVTVCGKIIEALRDRYFPGVNFTNILTGFDGTRADAIARHFREGPIQHS